MKTYFTGFDQLSASPFREVIKQSIKQNGISEGICKNTAKFQMVSTAAGKIKFHWAMDKKFKLSTFLGDLSLCRKTLAFKNIG